MPSTQTITDLDLIAGPAKKVRLGGTVYKLPADIPTPLWLKVTSYEGQEIDADLIRDLYAELLELFRVHQPELERLPIGLATLTQALPRIYLDTDEDGERPTRARAAGTRNSSPRKRSRSSR